MTTKTTIDQKAMGSLESGDFLVVKMPNDTEARHALVLENFNEDNERFLNLVTLDDTTPNVPKYTTFPQVGFTSYDQLEDFYKNADVHIVRKAAAVKMFDVKLEKMWLASELLTNKLSELAH